MLSLQSQMTKLKMFKVAMSLTLEHLEGRPDSARLTTMLSATLPSRVLLLTTTMVMNEKAALTDVVPAQSHQHRARHHSSEVVAVRR